MKILFATSNVHKFSEATEILLELDKKIELEHFKFEHNEIRSESVEDIAIEAVIEARKQCKKTVFVEDTGLFISALNGFPGTYSGWVQKKIGNPGILKLLEGEKNRGALFRTCIAVADETGVKTFVSECDGQISQRELGKRGFGYDSIFIPGKESQTFAENAYLKNKYSHRYKSLLMLAKYLAARK